MATRVLILSAGIGEGHNLPARMIADGLLELEPECELLTVDSLAEMGRAAALLVDDGSELMFDRFNWLFDGVYFLVSRFDPTRRIGQWLAERLGRKGLIALIAAQRPDVIVCTHPAATDLLGRLRRRGELGTPVASAITDLAGLRYWAHPGADLHLITEEESRTEVERIAPASRIVCVRGMTSPEFEQPLSQVDARAALEMPADGPLILVSGGGWAVGDLGGAAEVALAADPTGRVVILCGRSEQVQTRLTEAFALAPRAKVIGFTERMPELLAAADVLVHSTAGLTAFEARIRGCQLISYGWGVAHIRLNNEAYERFGLAEVAADRGELADALARALHRPRTADLGYDQRLAAAAEVLALAGAAQ
jgi:UDP-N-acetylglucosamine:LPS N-acetylglucosamine transferase